MTKIKSFSYKRWFSLCRLRQITGLRPSNPRRCQPNGRKAQVGGFNPGNHISGPPRNMWRYFYIVLMIIVAGTPTLIGFFSPTLPLWLAGLPLMAAIVAGTRLSRAIAMGIYLLWPIIASASALVTLGYSAVHVWPLAGIALVVFAATAAGIGLTALAVILTGVTVFPASPVLLIADALPGSSLIGPAVLLIGFAIAETRRHLWQRATIVLMLGGAAFAWGMFHDPPEPPETAWQVMPEPRLITERARWIALRDSLPKGAQAIFGENLFAADNHAAAAFWCAAVRSRSLTLWIGVMADDGRGQIWRFNPESCAGPRGGAVIVHAARYGIPGITGTWRAMDAITDPNANTNPNGPSGGTNPSAANPVDWLICFEAFLPWAWFPILSAETHEHPVVILSNDRAFGSLPISTLRHKVSRAMGRLTGRTLLHAETGKTFLLKGPA